VALSDPELDLLRELLVEDPEADVWAQVAEELVRRTEWSEAVRVLKRGVELEPGNLQAWGWYARACYEIELTSSAMDAIEHLPFDPAEEREAAQLRILIFEQAGDEDACRALIQRYKHFDADDVVVNSVLERLDRPEPVSRVVNGTTRDPLINMERAQLYIAVGRPDRAARVYRRILFHHRDYKPAAAGLRELGEDAWGALMTEDLSHELVDPATAPPALNMPEPKLAAFEADEEITEPRALLSAIESYARGEGANPLPGSFGEDDDPQTDEVGFEELGDAADKLGLGKVGKKPRKRRRRRSLLQR